MSAMDLGATPEEGDGLLEEFNFYANNIRLLDVTGSISRATWIMR